MEFKILNDLNDDIIKIRHEAFVIGRGVPKEIELDGRDGELLHFCLYDNDTLVSYLRAEEVIGNMLHVGRVATNRKMRKKGYGRKLFEYLFDFATKKGYSAVEVSAVHTAQGFYEKLGFIAEGDYYLETGVNHIYMKRSLLK